MNKVFVTGADGMLGNSIVRELLILDYQVKCLVQPGRNNGTLAGLPVEIVEGDLMQPESWKHEVAGCDFMINAAACTTVNPGRNKLCYDINTRAVETLAAICTEFSVKKFIQVGSATSFPEGSRQHPGKETGKYSMAKFRMDYMDSKFLAQQYLLKVHRETGFPAVIINPTFMIGKYDSLPSSGKMIIAITRNMLPGFSEGGKSFVSARDVAVATVNAIKLGKPGHCYIAGGENLSYREFFAKVCRVNSVQARYRKIPSALVLAFGFISTMVARIRGNTPALSYSMARVSLINQFYSSEKAIAELKMPQTSIETAIKECTEWLKENKML